jgi:hypothetical protein
MTTDNYQKIDMLRIQAETINRWRTINRQIKIMATKLIIVNQRQAALLAFCNKFIDKLRKEGTITQQQYDHFKTVVPSNSWQEAPPHESENGKKITTET